MIVAIYKNRVVLGPCAWNRAFAQAVFADKRIECAITLPLRLENKDLPLVISDDLVIKQAKYENQPMNEKIEMSYGPFFDLDNDIAIVYNKVKNKSIEVIQNELKARAAALRWQLENSGTTIEIQGTTVSIGTSREARSAFNNKLNTVTTQVNWKFPEAWISLTKEDLTTIITAIDNYVQQQFDAEYAKSIEIESAVTVEDLDAIIIGDEPEDPVDIESEE